MGEKRYNREAKGDPKIRRQGIIRSIIDLLVSDLIENTLRRIDQFSIKKFHDVGRAPEKDCLIFKRRRGGHRRAEGLSHGEPVPALPGRPHDNEGADGDPGPVSAFTPGTRTRCPEDYQKKYPKDGVVLTATDYIAGMTDRFALEEHQKLTDPMIRV